MDSSVRLCINSTSKHPEIRRFFRYIGGYMPYYGGYYGATVNICDWYWWKYEQTGKFKYKKKYMKCMGYL